MGGAAHVRILKPFSANMSHISKEKIKTVHVIQNNRQNFYFSTIKNS